MPASRGERLGGRGEVAELSGEWDCGCTLEVGKCASCRNVLNGMPIAVALLNKVHRCTVELLPVRLLMGGGTIVRAAKSANLMRTPQ